jgi:hypothetical protein
MWPCSSCGYHRQVTVHLNRFGKESTGGSSYDLIYWSYWLVVDWLFFGDLFCQAKNMNRNGMVMTAVVIRIGWNDVGSILIPKSCKKGSGKTVYIQKPASTPKINLFRFRTETKLILFIFLRSHVIHFLGQYTTYRFCFDKNNTAYLRTLIRK